MQIWYQFKIKSAAEIAPSNNGVSTRHQKRISFRARLSLFKCKKGANLMHSLDGRENEELIKLFLIGFKSPN